MKNAYIRGSHIHSRDQLSFEPDLENDYWECGVCGESSKSGITTTEGVQPLIGHTSDCKGNPKDRNIYLYHFGKKELGLLQHNRVLSRDILKKFAPEALEHLPE